MKYLFYNRQSSSSQNAARQIEAFKRVGEVNKWNLYSDICSGAIAFKKRDSAVRLWDEATSSTASITIVVKSIDRLGRNLKDILSTVDDFTAKGINIQFLKEGFNTLNSDGKVNTFGKIILAVMGSIAEAERERIKERQAEGIAIAKTKGVYLENGKKRLGKVESKEKFLLKHKDVQVKLSAGLSYREIRTLTGKSLATITKVAKSINHIFD
jgi:DNA invertase Pin-like site-specific DNA recombinase